MTSIPEPADPFEDDGLPAGEDGLPGKIITGDAQDGIVPPADHAIAVDDFGTTPREMAEGESLTDRLDELDGSPAGRATTRRRGHIRFGRTEPGESERTLPLDERSQGLADQRTLSVVPVRRWASARRSSSRVGVVRTLVS
jgi:hypothetical protein